MQIFYITLSTKNARSPSLFGALFFQAEVRPVTLEDAGFIARCCSSGLGEVGRSETLVRGLIGRNPSAGVRRGSQLVAW